jgi:hypothetical protein
MGSVHMKGVMASHAAYSNLESQESDMEGQERWILENNFLTK